MLATVLGHASLPLMGVAIHTKPRRDPAIALNIDPSLNIDRLLNIDCLLNIDRLLNIDPFAKHRSLTILSVV